MIGCDPECFLVDEKGNAVSSIGLIGGSKEEPRPVPFGAVQEDNVLAEINITPVNIESAWIKNLLEVENSLKDIIKEHKLGLSWAGSHMFAMEQLQHPKAIQFGCDPDFNIYTGDVTEPKVAPPALRTAGGHIHISFGKVTPINITKAVKLCDIFFLPFEAMEGDATDKRRTKLYGGKGTFRPKPYGIEYRGVSNFWMRSEMRRRLAFRFANYIQYAIEQNIGEGERLIKNFQSLIENGNHFDQVYSYLIDRV